MRVLILTSYTPHNIYLVNFLTVRANIVAKVIEKRPLLSSIEEKMAMRGKMLKKYGLFKTVNKLIYNKYKSFSLKDTGIIVKESLFPESEEIKYAADIPTIEVPDINDRKCIDFISEYGPDIIAVCGTSVIKPEVFNLSKKGTINIHCGITPEYKSADPAFWALYNNEPDKVGVTIHFVDAGIDTGDIIYQEPVEVTKDDSLATLYCKCIKTGAHLMMKAISDIENGSVKTIRKDHISGKSYYSINLGIWQYLIFQRRFKKLKRNMQFK